MKKRGLFITIPLVLLFTCSFNYEAAMIAEDISEEVPETIQYDFTLTRVSGTQPEFNVSAARAESYKKKKQTVLSYVLFQEFNEKHEVITEGIADHLLFFSETENAEMSGNLSFYSVKEKARIKGEYLLWQKENEILTSKPENTILLQRDSGSWVEGSGFEADFRLKNVRFSGSIRGKYISDDDKKE
ncbi:MAG: LPS export ABC transporter periplasmic protein LptC [Spirochaetota bacterium]